MDRKITNNLQKETCTNKSHTNEKNCVATHSILTMCLTFFRMKQNTVLSGTRNVWHQVAGQTCQKPVPVFCYQFMVHILVLTHFTGTQFIPTTHHSIRESKLTHFFKSSFTVYQPRAPSLISRASPSECRGIENASKKLRTSGRHDQTLLVSYALLSNHCVCNKGSVKVPIQNQNHTAKSESKCFISTPIQTACNPDSIHQACQLIANMRSHMQTHICQ